MARALRNECPDRVYHGTSRGNSTQVVFPDERDHLEFMDVFCPVIKRYNVLLILVLSLTLFCLAGCSKPASDILTELSGVWRFSDNSLLTIKHDNGSIYLTSGKSVITARVGAIDTKNKTVKLRVVLPDGLDAIWTIKLVSTSDNRTVYLELTLHDGKNDVLQFVRKV
jgi:hypothetical protein